MEEAELYEPARKFLRSKGFRAVVTHGKANVKIWIGDILPYKEHIEPDVVGITRSWTETVCIEAKAELAGKDVFEVLGKCVLWRIAARNVYVVIPERKGLKTEGFKLLGIGLITVCDKGETKEVISPSGYTQQDVTKSQELYNQALRAVTSEFGVLEVSYANAIPTLQGWQIPLAMKNVGLEPIKVVNILMDGKPYSTYNCYIEPTTVSPSAPLEIAANSERKLSLSVPRGPLFEKGKWIQIDFQVEDGIEKGFSISLPA